MQESIANSLVWDVGILNGVIVAVPDTHTLFQTCETKVRATFYSLISITHNWSKTSGFQVKNANVFSELLSFILN